MPGALIADRSAGSPGSYIVGSNLYVIHPRRHPLLLPGLTIHPRRGPGALPGDVELWIERILNGSNGEANVNALRDNARQITPQLRTARSLKKLNQLISVAMNTGHAAHSKTSQLRARASGTPVDRHRIGLFAALADELNRTAPHPSRLHPTVPGVPSCRISRRIFPTTSKAPSSPLTKLWR